MLCGYTFGQLIAPYYQRKLGAGARLFCVNDDHISQESRLPLKNTSNIDLEFFLKSRSMEKHEFSDPKATYI